MEGVINIQDFANYLKDNNLIIVSEFDYERKSNYKEIKLKETQEKYLKKDYLDFKEILLGKLLPITSRQSIINWINNGTFKKHETFVSPDDGRIKIITSAINRVRKLKNYDI